MSSTFIPLLMHSGRSTECIIHFRLPMSTCDAQFITAAVELVADCFEVELAWSRIEERRAMCVVPCEVGEAFLNALHDALIFASGQGQQQVHFCTDETKPPHPR
ncbi:hypothetical protein [Paraburkholderia azotifigens]|uniref:Uncharacterized protein n=1 Tax=Paraburkholderia azotifigens TaxID=2057004 RepID=A0A5C6VG12_9BURK|nr:hypothetical protein [Paraburkholderia azotifigens]TXC83819.1 hypothetical protein FRZ40_26095 [Paraburkholderia azotifigens]